MTIHPFPNAKSKLLGNPEDSIGIIDTPAVAGLSGNVTADITDLSTFVFKPNTGSISSTTTEQVIATTVVSNEFAKNSLKIQVQVKGTSGFGAQASRIRLRRGGLTGTILVTTQVNGTGAVTINQTETDLVIGDTTYVLTTEKLSPSAHTVGNYPDGMSGIVFLTEINDTHVGIIATPATATKQINSPDSHTTHETMVIQ